MKKAMKRLSAAIISLAMLVSLMPMTVFADETETDVPAATSSADNEHPDDSGKPKEKKKPAAETTKEAEKPTETTKETEKPSAETSKETEKQTEETVKETEKPVEETTKETEPEEPKETEKTVPEETKGEEPAESGESKEAESSETEAPKETEETGSDPAETTETPEETEPSETDTTKIPDESTNSKAKKTGTIANAKISEDGILTWTPVEGVYVYEVHINDVGAYDWYNTSDEEASLNLKETIDYMIKHRDIDKSNSYEISMYSYDDDWNCLDEWSDSFVYTSGVEPIVVGEIKDVTFNSGMMTWTPYKDADTYEVSVDEYGIYISDNSIGINKRINYLIRSGYINKSENDSYQIEIVAYDSEEFEIARWSGNYTYKTSAEPVVVGKIEKVKCTEGTLTWEEYTGATRYTVEIECCGDDPAETNSYDLGKQIDKMIKEGDIPNNEDYFVIVVAYDKEDVVIAKWKGSIAYQSSASLIDVGEIANVTINSGVMTWTPYDGAVSYDIFVHDCSTSVEDECSIDINDHIDYLIRLGWIDNQSPYPIRIVAYDDDSAIIAEWTDDYVYDSGAVYVEPDEITNINFNNGIMTWDAYTKTEFYCYRVEISDSDDNCVAEFPKVNSLDIQKVIADAIKSGDLNQESSYSVYIAVEDDEGITLAKANKTYNYSSSPTQTSISSAKVTGISDKTYTGSEITLTISVTLSGKTLTEGTDYTVTYENNTNVGTAAVTITGIGNYKGTINRTFKINQASIADATVTGIADKTYTGSEIEQSFVVNVGGNVLEADTDYTVEYSNNTNVGKATVTITGKGNYKGTVSRTFMITAADISTGSVTGISDKTYTGSEISQTYDLTVNGRKLTETTDYIVSYSDNTNAGTATVMFIGKGNYTGTLNATFKINPASIAAALVTGIIDMGYTGSAITQEPLVTLDGKTLEKDTDYTVSYDNNTAIGTATVTIKGIGNYEGTIEKKFSIKAPTNISTATVTGAGEKSYTGKEIELDLTVTFDGKTLVKGTDYTVSYENNVEIGTATYTITGAGIYTGTITGTFEIVQAPNSLRAKGKTANIKYKKKKQTVKASKLYYYYNKGQGTLTFKKAGGNSKFTVNAKTGNITVRKKTKKGTYRIKVKIKAAGNTNYLPSDFKTVTVVIKIKK